MATAKPLWIRPFFLLARRLRRVGFVCGRWAFAALRLSTTGAFLFVTLASPFSQARAQSRASFSSRQYDEFSTSREDGDYFSPDRLRQRLHSLDTMVEGLNNRFARLQGRSLDRGSSENLTPQVFQAALERFQAAAQFSSEIEMKRAQFSQTLASAGGFQFRSYPDGRRMWFKNGRVHRIENEKITDGQGRVGHQDVVDMAYDRHANLLSSKTIFRDADGHLTTKNWTGSYADGANGKSVLASFAETTWDPLGNESKIERTGIAYGDGGKNPISYQETTTDKYGQTSRRTVTGSSYDGDGNLLSFHEESEENGVAQSKDWSGAVYQKYQRDGKDAWRLTSYNETTTDAQGRQSRREWGGATYDENNSLKSYTQKDTDPSGESRVLTWGGARYDARGNVAEFTETVKSPEGESRRSWRGGQYDAHGRLTDFEELNVDAQGVSTSRRWSGAEYNAKGDLLRYRETNVDGHGLESARTWTAGSYKDGRLTAYSESTVDDRGHAARRQWSGFYGTDHRLASFSEESTDALGNVTRRGQEGLTYDSLGRAQSYDEWSEDIFGQRTAARWTAAGYDAKDRLSGYQLVETIPSGRTMTTLRSAMTYDAAGRLAQYNDELAARGGYSPDATGRQTVRVLSFDAFGQATLTQTTATNALGETTERTHQAEYDGRGRLASTADTLLSADGAADVARWSVDAFDEYDRATASREITGAGDSEKTKFWSGRFDAKGLATESTETTTDARGLSITTRLSGAVYNAQGRLTDSLQVTQRTDLPGVTIETRTAEQTYDRAGVLAGGREVTRTIGEWDGQPLDVTTVRRTEEAVLAGGFVTGYRQTVLTTGVSDGRSLHTQDETLVVLGAKGDRTETTHRLAFSQDETLETDAYSTLRRTNLVADLGGRALSYTEDRSEDFSPLAKTTTRRENRYSAAGVLTGFTEDSVDGLGLRTHSETTGLVENAAGQMIASRERITHPGQTVVADEIVKSEMAYSPLGQLASYREQTLSTGPGLSMRADAQKTLSYDGAGRVIAATEAGARNGSAYTANTFHVGFDLKGRPVHSVEQSTGPGGPSNIERSAVAFDDFGRRVSYHEEGVSGGSMVHQTVVAEYDALGREAATETTGFRESGAFHERNETTGFNDLGQSTGRRVTGHSAAEGDYAYSQTGQVYGLAGDLISFDKERTDADGITRSHWTSKGTDARGRSLGYTETGSVAKDGRPLYEFTTDHTAGAYTLQNQASSYAAVTTKRYANGAVESAATRWTDGAYDTQGRLTAFKETQTTTLTDNGETKSSTSSRLRESATYYDDNGPGHLKGQLASTVDVLLDDLSPEKARRVRTADMAYDAEGRSLGAETTTGDVNRLKDALRRLGDLLRGGAKAGGNIRTGLRQLLENTANLTSEVLAWATDNLVSPAQDFLEGLGVWLADVADDQGTANPALDRETVSELVYRIHEKAGGANLEEIPAGFQSAAAALGTFDQSLSVTRAVDKVFDAQGRATAWREIALSASAPDRPSVTDVRVTYKDGSRLLSTYAARTVEGDKVTQLFRDHYTYDALNRGFYREATFEGEDLALLFVEKGTVSTTEAQWGSLKDEARSLLLSDILAGGKEILGKVDFKQIDDATFDAAGNMLDIFGTRTTRGVVLSDFAQAQALPSDYDTMVESAREAAQAEYDQSLASQKEIADLAQAQAAQRETDLPPLEVAAQEAADRLDAANTAKEDALARLATAELQKARMDAAISQFRSDHKEIARSLPDGLPLVSSRDYVKDGQTYRDTVTTWNIKVLKFDDVGNLVQSLVYRTQTTTVLASARPSDPPIEVTVAETEARAGTRMGGFGGARSGTVILRAADSDSVWADKMNNGDDRNINGHYLPWLNSFAVESLKRLAGLHRNRARAADDIARSTTDVDIAAKRMETDTADLTRADQAVSSARSALVAAQNAARSFRAEFESMDSAGRAVLEAAKARMTGRLQTDAAALAKTFSGLDLILNGPLRLTEEEALALVTRGAFDHAGQSLSLGALASAKVKTSLNNEEHFAQLSVANPQKSVSLSWKGDLRLNGAPVTKTALSAVLTPNALAAPPAADGSVSGLSVGEGGRLTVNRTLAQTQDAAGRITSQNTETFTLSRTDGKTMTRRTRQETAGHRYDARGQLIGYVRTTREDGKDPVVETLTGATYDDTGRQTSSDVRVTEASANGLVSRNVHTDILSFNAAGQAVRSRRVVDSGGQVTVTQDVADALLDGEGRTVFSLSDSVGTSRESWERAGGNFSALSGERTRSAGWTTAFDDRGQALSTLRVSTPNLGGTARHFIIETNRNTYDGAGRLSLSTTDSTEIGSDPQTRSSFYKSGREERRALAFTSGGQALRERVTRTENGLTTVTEDETDRVFDEQGRVIQTQTVITDAQGLKSHSLWKALAFDANGRSRRFERTTTDAADLKTVERSAEDATYDDQGRLMSQSLDVTEWNAPGTESRSYRKTEDHFDYDGFGRVRSLRQTTDKTDSHGAASKDTRTVSYGYDQSGRVVNTWTDGVETAGDQRRDYHYGTAVLSFDALGRNARTRTTTLQDGLRTDRFSTIDISYDALGRVVKSRDLVHQWGVGLDAYTTEETTNDLFDTWGRAVDSLSIVTNGALKTVSHSHGLAFDANGRLTRQTIDLHESSTLPGIELTADRTITQTDMKYDAIGNLVDYAKVLKEGDLETTSRPALLEYDKNGRSVVSLERVTDNFDRDEIVGNVGSQYNELGQLIGGQSVTIKGDSKALNGKQLSGIVAAILNGDLQSVKGQTLVKSLGLEGLWANRTVSPTRYDAQGRMVFTDTVMDKAGWGWNNVTETKVLFAQTIGRWDRWAYEDRVDAIIAQMKAQGLSVTNKTFQISGDTKHHRYCYASVTYVKQVWALQDTHERSTNAVTAFDALNRPIDQTLTTLRGANTTVNRQRTDYDAQGRVIALESRLRETGINGDGSTLNRRFNQRQSFTYDAAGRSSAEVTRTWGDSAAPLKDTTSTVDQIVYASGQRVAWSETTTSTERTQQNVRRMDSVQYDGLGRIAAYNADTYEGEPGALQLQYSDRDARNTYDALSRLVLTLGLRNWGRSSSPLPSAASPGLSPSPLMGEGRDGGETGVPGGGVQGLSDGWTAGSVTLAIAYEYANGSSSISGQWITAHGTGSNAEASVRAAGINLNHHEYGMRYDSVGRVIAYKVTSTQIEKYDYYKQGQKGLKRKIKKGSTTGAVTTQSDVVVTEFDGFGRTIRSVTESQRNDINRTWTRTETLVKSFDTNGRALDVERKTDSRMELPTQRGGIGGVIHKALGKVGSWMLAISTGLLLAPVIASGSLGGQKMYSSSAVAQRLAYRANGTLDESRTETNTISESSYIQGQNMGDIMMQVSDIAVAVAAVAVAVAATIAAGATGGTFAGVAAATWKTAALCVTVAAAGYRTMRSGISTHDLQLFGQDRDRAESRQNTMNFVSSWGSVAVAGAASWMKTVPAFKAVGSTTGALNSLGRNILVGFEIGLQMAAAQAGGADAKTMWSVGALAAATTFVNGGSGSAKMSGLQGLIAIAGSAAQNIGMTFGKSSQRTTWMLVGSVAQGAAYGKSEEMRSMAVQSGLKGYLVNLYAAKNDGSGLTDRARARRGMLVDGFGQLGGAMLGQVLPRVQEVISEGIDRLTGNYQRMLETLKNNPEIARQIFAETGVSSAEELPYNKLKVASKFIIETRANSPFKNFPLNPPLNDWPTASFEKQLQGNDRLSLFSDNNRPLESLWEDRPVVAQPIDGAVFGQRFAGLFSPQPGVLEVKPNETFYFAGKTWQPGTQLVLTDVGLEIHRGILLENNFSNLKWENDVLVPVVYERSPQGPLRATGIAFDQLRDSPRFTVTGPTRVANMDLRSGAFTIKNNSFIFEDGTLFKVDKTGWNLFYQPDNQPAQLLKATLNGDRFKASIDRFAVNDGTAASLISIKGLSLNGSVTQGQIHFDLGAHVPVAVELLGSDETGTGSGTAFHDANGQIHLNVRIDQGSSWVRGWPLAGAKGDDLSNKTLGATTMRFDNRFFIKAYDALHNRAQVTGSFWLLDQTKVAFGEGSEFQLKRGVELPSVLKNTLPTGAEREIQMIYSQEKPGQFLKISGGIIVPTEGVIGRDETNGLIHSFGADGQSQVTVPLAPNGRWAQPRMTSSGVPLAAEEIKNPLTGHRQLIVHGLGLSDRTFTLKLSEARGANAETPGLTIARNRSAQKWARRTVLMPGAALTPLLILAADRRGVSTEGAVAFSYAGARGLAAIIRNGTIVASTLTGSLVESANFMIDKASLQIHNVRRALAPLGFVKESPVPHAINPQTLGDRALLLVMKPSEKISLAMDDMMKNADAVTAEQMAGLSGQKTTAAAQGGAVVQLAQLPAGFIAGLAGARTMDEYQAMAQRNILGSYGAMGEEVSQSLEGIFMPWVQIGRNIDEHGNGVAWGMGAVQLGMSGAAYLGIAKGASTRGATAWNAKMGIDPGGFTELTTSRRLLNTGGAVVKNMAYHMAQTLMPGAEEMAVRAEWALAREKIAINRAAERATGIDDVPGIRVRAVLENHMILESRGGEGARWLRHDELSRFNEILAKKGMTAEIGFYDAESFNAAIATPKLLDLFGSRGMENIKMLTERALDRSAGLYDASKVALAEQNELVHVYQAAREGAEGKLASGMSRELALRDLLDKNQEGVIDGREYIQKVLDLVPDWKKGPGTLQAYDDIGRIPRELGQGGEVGRSFGGRIREGLSRLFGEDSWLRRDFSENRRPTSEADGFIRASEAVRAASRAEGAASRAEGAASQRLNEEIQIVARQNGIFKERISELQFAEDGARSRATELGRGTQHIKATIGEYWEYLNLLDQEIASREHPRSLPPPKNSIKLTAQWREGPVLDLLHSWRNLKDSADFSSAPTPIEAKSLGAAAARDFGDPANTKYEIVRPKEQSTVSPDGSSPSTAGIGLPNASLRQRLLNFIFGEKLKTESVSPNVSAEGPPLSKPDSAHAVIDDLDNSLGYIDGKPMPTPDHFKTFNPGETLPSGDKAGKGPGAASLSEYIETTLTKSEVISQGRLGFDPAFESKGAAESGMVGLSKSGLEAFRVLREAGIRVSVGSEAAWGELNAAGSHFINEVFNSPTRTNKLTTTSDGTRFLDITDNKGRTVRATEKGDFVGFIVDRPEALPQWNPKALPPSRAGPAAKLAPEIMTSKTLLLSEVPDSIRTSIGNGLQKIKPTQYDGVVYRNVNTKYAADFSNIVPSTNKRFRYNPKGDFGAGYYSELPENSFSEIQAHGMDPFQGRTIVRAHVRAKVLDLTNPQNLSILGLTESQLTGKHYSIPIEVARQARSYGFEGLKVPQAGGTGKANIVLFTDLFGTDAFITKIDQVNMGVKSQTKP